MLRCDGLRRVEINKEFGVESDERNDLIQRWWQVHLR